MSRPLLQPLLDQADARQKDIGLWRRWGSVLGGSGAREREAEARQILETLHAHGYLGVIPGQHETKKIKNSEIQVSVGRPGTINLRTTRNGRACVQGLEDPTLGRWMVLIHEAAHQEQQLIEKNRTIPGLDQDSETILANWTWSGWGQTGNYLRGMLGENFADAYAYMVMVRTLDNTDRLEDTLSQMIRLREADERKNDNLLLDVLRSGDMEYLSTPLSIHRTGRTLRLVEQTRKEWIHLDAEQLRQKALDLAAAGLASTLDAQRTDDNGFPIGLVLRGWAAPATPDEELPVMMGLLAQSYLDGTNTAVLKQEIDNLPNRYQAPVRHLLDDTIDALKRAGLDRARQPGSVMTAEDQALLDRTWQGLLDDQPGSALAKAKNGLQEAYWTDRNTFIEAFIVKPLAEHPTAQRFMGANLFLAEACANKTPFSHVVKTPDPVLKRARP